MDARTPNLPPAGSSKPASKTYCFHYGSAQRPLATVVPDIQWPGMWRIEWPDGRLSDMVNLTRAKDTSEVIAERGPQGRLDRLAAR